MNFDEVSEKIFEAISYSNYLQGILYLKGGQGLKKISDQFYRYSKDVDFSLEEDLDVELAQKEFYNNLSFAFNGVGLSVIDLKITSKPEVDSHGHSSWWGGYVVEFKVIPTKNKSLDQSRNSRSAIQIGHGKSTIEIEISKHEYVHPHTQTNDDYQIKIYTPALLLCEKIRALCQQMPEYPLITHPRSRARDFYDIHFLLQKGIVTKEQEILESLPHCFNSKQVPIELMLKIRDYQGIHREDWKRVEATLPQDEFLQNFDYHLEFVANRAEKWFHLCQ